MTGRIRFAVALLSAGAIASLCQAQSPSGTGPTGKAATGKTSKSAAAPSPYRRQSIVHHNPYPYPEHYYDDNRAGFRNPGGVGRYAEYYPPGGHYQAEYANPGRTAPVATFDFGNGPPSRQQQIQAQQLGVQKDNAIQQHIDRYAQPYFGYGVGFYGGYY